MTLLDIKSLETKINRTQIPDILIGVGQSINPYSNNPLQNYATLKDFFQSFPEGDRTLTPTHFYVQKRIKPKGRVGIRYHFDSSEDEIGIISFSVLDNGENVPQPLFDEVYSVLKTYALIKKLKIVKENLTKE